MNMQYMFGVAWIDKFAASQAPVAEARRVEEDDELFTRLIRVIICYLM